MYPLKQFRINSTKKIKVFLRARLNLYNFPVGYDKYGNEFYDNGVIRKVVNSTCNPTRQLNVRKSHSDWLNYKTDHFPEYVSEQKMGMICLISKIILINAFIVSFKFMALVIIKIGLRNVFSIKKYPIGADRFMNTFYDNGLIRKVNKSEGLNLMPVFVDKKYSDWLNYRSDNFPKFDLEFRLQNVRNKIQDFDSLHRLAFKELNRECLIFDPYSPARVIRKQLI
ncbi:hypothetical protein BpHYR1_036755 [Brachionus plicatilis]|uniref:Uncharacterized protein n=1 Tax=Brachionus plicatilis TaxID=10195 RepID=A0A3M7QJU0_BRAPC|nr:hypothetical protein BpHYR1_036755 [Brachionus plicatilis]